MEPLLEHGFDVEGHRTRALELEGQGPPLLLLHGYGDSADTWRPVLDELGRRDRRALAVDLPGYGRASKLAAGPVLPQLDAFAHALIRRLAEETGQRVVVAGNSLGGAIALRAGEHRDLPLAGLVPVAPAGLELPRWFDVIERDPVLRRLLALPIPIPDAVLRASVAAVYRRLVFPDGAKVAPGIVDMFVAHHPGRSGVAALLEAGRRLLPELSEDPFDLARIEVPVRLVWGTRDRMVPHAGSRRVLDALPDTELVLLHGVGHCPQLEVPGRMAELLLDVAGAPAARAS